LKKSIFAAVFLLIASLAMADTLNLTGLPAFTYSGVYVGPASGNLNGGPSFSLICNDYVDTSYIPSSFSVNVSTIPSLVFAMYAQPWSAGALANYEMAAMLLWQMDQPVNQTSAGIGGLNFAIWNIFNPSVPDPGTSASWVAWAQSQDLTAWDYSGVRVFTPLAGGNNGHGGVNQEFMSGSASPVPEPATLGLIGMGLIACGVVGRRRPKKE
jgi:hypothetical protein